jgi:hypothetical protein
MPKGTPTTPDREVAKQKLEDAWCLALNDEATELDQEIEALVNSNQVSIRFCLPTQLLGKLVDPTLDALCLQRAQGGEGRWDARGFASRVIVPWNRNNQAVLGTSGDPYVNNPLRRPHLDDQVSQEDDAEQWERLRSVIRRVQNANDPAYTEAVFFQVMLAIRDRLRDLTFTYIIPARVSVRQVEDLVQQFLADKSGGERGLAVCASLFETFRERLGIYKKIRRGMTNAADASMNAAGDLECVAEDGSIVLVVEVKERRIGDADVQIALGKARALSVREILLCTEGVQPSDQQRVEQTCASAWASGTNIYHATIGDLIRGTMPILGEDGAKEFVVQIGRQLDRFGTQPRHRKTWKTLLDGL